MIPNLYRYPLDPTGLNPNNLVVDEEHQLSTRRIRCVAPTYGGFFADGVIVKNALTGIQLIKGKDYNFGELFEFPTGRYGKEIFGIIIIYNTSVTRVSITYQALGGNYSYSMESVVSMIDSLDLGERPVAWGDIVGRPALFDPASHFHDIGDVYGFEYVVHSIERLRTAILLGDTASHDEIYRYIDAWNDDLQDLLDDLRATIASHTSDKNNPHGVTKNQVGLGSVQNYGLATEAEARSGTVNNKYMTPLRTAQAIETLALAPLTSHVNNSSNPHGVTKAQVGLGSVENYGIATAEEAIAGTVNNKYMTPLRVMTAINNAVGARFDSHVNNRSNPHGVTKAQVGLSLVENYTVATPTQVRDGVATNLYVNPEGVKFAVDSWVTAGNYDNRFILNNRAVPGSIRTDSSGAYVYHNNAWRKFWPPQWQ